MTNKLTAEQKRLVEELEELLSSRSHFFVSERNERITKIKKELGLSEDTLDEETR